MTMLTESFFEPGDDRSTRRWIFAGALVLAVHAGFLSWLVWRSQTGAEGAPPEAIMLELDPVAASPPSETQVEAPPGPLMTESQPEVVEEPEHLDIPDLPPVPKAAAVLTPAPKVKPVKKPIKIPERHVVTPTHEKPAPRTTAPAHAAASSRAAAAGRKGSAGSSVSPSAWMSEVHARIQAHHSCAAGARGTAKVAFSIDRGGHILGVSLIASSGSAALDQAAVSTVRRSNPLPAPPPQVGGSISIPVSCH
ncbi:energy transducer TonB family protein [Methylocapsa palsarum]|uniref:Protein TonB n=1 Tax=Methylocapsa palsarum TaxID=1612308 RepID=A0A1I3XCS4_9HYPH|nr:TonB family protein [Methylocapsa palsarum]SFK17320.1 protein TonB [Methylocapsa palsarum]